VKVINKSVPGIIEVLEEALLLQRIEHPFIIKFFENFQDDDCHYIIIEYCKVRYTRKLTKI
jgi:serine/threonine protein kinase